MSNTLKTLAGIAVGFYAIAAALGYLNGWGMWADDYEPPQAQAAPEPVEMTIADAETARSVLRYRCREIIRRVLNDPSSAEFDDARNWRFTDDGDGVYTIYPTLRAKNAFGALIRTGFRCQVQMDGDSWELLALDEI